MAGEETHTGDRSGYGLKRLLNGEIGESNERNIPCLYREG